MPIKDDPIARTISWQLRSINFENLKNSYIAKWPPSDTLENKLVGAFDMKYNPNAFDEERKRDLLEWMRLGVPREDLAVVMGKSRKTVWRWMSQIKASI